MSHLQACEFCALKFSTVEELAQHQTSTHSFICPHCEVDFHTPERLLAHGEVIKAVCPYCGDGAVADDALERHVKEAHSFQCPHCRESSVTQEGILDHLRSTHAPECRHCLDFLDAKDVGEDKEGDGGSLSTELVAVPCPLCDRVIAAEDLPSHFGQDHQCGRCGSVFHKKDSLLSHQHPERSTNESSGLADSPSSCIPRDGERVRIETLVDHLTSHRLHLFKCHVCDALLREDAELRQHVESHARQCSDCSFKAPSQQHLDRHLIASHCLPCRNCTSKFGSDETLEQHVEKEHSFKCDLCIESRVFVSEAELAAHQASSAHSYECNMCETSYTRTTLSYEDHARSCRPESSDTPPSGSPIEVVLGKHLTADTHRCTLCDIPFDSANSLDTHLSSPKHGTLTFPCPAASSKECVKSVASAHAILMHLESGKCKYVISRFEVNEYAVKLDVDHQITDPTLLIESNSPRYKMILSATADAWNGRTGMYMCYMCDAGFQALDSLNHHLGSPVHDSQLYKCPKDGCSRFKTLSGLAQHVTLSKCGASLSGKLAGLMNALRQGQIAF